MTSGTQSLAQKYILGIDGGGTSTRAIICDISGTVLGFGTSSSSNILHAGEANVENALNDAVDKAATQASVPATGFAAAFLGLAGIVNEVDRQTIRRLIAPMKWAEPAYTGIDHDIRIALAGGLTGAPGLALISGTGSACYGRNETGEKHQCGGHEFLADDVGSGSWIGRQALKSAVRQADGRAPLTTLKDTVFEFLEIESIDYFIHRVHVKSLGRAELASLAPRILELAQAGDSAALTIQNRAVEELTQLASVTARMLDIENSAKVILAGGIACSEAIRPRLEASIRTALPDAQIHAPATDPTGGAAMEAMRLRNITLTPGIACRLNQRP